jgi:hypothetical protein
VTNTSTTAQPGFIYVLASRVKRLELDGLFLLEKLSAENFQASQSNRFGIDASPSPPN